MADCPPRHSTRPSFLDGLRRQMLFILLSLFLAFFLKMRSLTSDNEVYFLVSKLFPPSLQTVHCLFPFLWCSLFLKQQVFLQGIAEMLALILCVPSTSVSFLMTRQAKLSCSFPPLFQKTFGAKVPRSPPPPILRFFLEREGLFLPQPRIFSFVWLSLRLQNPSPPPGPDSLSPPFPFPLFVLIPFTRAHLPQGLLGC